MGKDKRRKHFKSAPYNQNNRRGNRRERNHSYEKTFNRQLVEPRTSIREDQVGITEFTNPEAPGFTGVLKSRFSDFHVNEIDKTGCVLELNDLTIPTDSVAVVDAAQLDELRDQLKLLVDEKLLKDMNELAKEKGNSEKKLEFDVTTLTKEQRTQIHQAIKQLYNRKLVSTTLSSAQEQTKESSVNTLNETKVLRIMKPKPGRGDNRWNFKGDYVTFLVHKVNIGTSEVATALANRLKLCPSQVNYCGTKDKRAKTTQNFCIKKRSPFSIVKAARTISNVHVGNFKFQSTTQKLGDLNGNRFRIALRHICSKQEEIEKALESLRERGFINYYGLQRFGNSADVPTYEVGIALLKRDYQLACELIMKPRENDLVFMEEVRKTWWENRDSAAASAMISGKNLIEKKLLDGLAKYGERDYSSALRCIPRNMLLLYPHSYQSLVFNRVASRRIREFGLQIIVGDLVYAELCENKTEIQPMDNEPAESTDTDVENSENINMIDDFLEEDSVFKKKVRPLTANDIASGNYKLSDVVLPLPGHDITYPSNECGKWYEEILQEVGLSSELLRHKEKTYSLAGAYRKLLIQPTDLKWNFRYYKKAEDTLIASDWEKMNSIDVTPEPAEDEEKNLKALLLEFSLPTAAYATMLLRELLKEDTSKTTQIQLQKEALKSSPVEPNVVLAESESDKKDIEEETKPVLEM